VADEKPEIIPITEQIEARVQDAVGELGVAKPEPKTEPPRPPESLELAEVQPFVKPKPEEPLLSPYEVKRGFKRIFKFLLIAAGLALIAGMALSFTDRGRLLLPASMRRPAKELAGEVEKRALGVEDYYTFTDDQGVVHFVDDLEKVPERYRSRAKKTR
jgi:hypothetical protein